jgi:thiosulfate dehydrogenase
MKCLTSSFETSAPTTAARGIVLMMLGALVGGCGGSKASEATPYERADLIRGARLYDNWMKEKAINPAEPNPSYSLTQGKSASVTATWRCSECHGWDYRGVEGAYSKGSHFTGVKGLLAAGGDSPQELFQIIHDGLAEQGMAAFAAEHLAEADVWDLVKFIKEGTVDLSGHIDSAGKPLIADAVAGKVLFEQGLGPNDSSFACAACHGVDGRTLNFHAPPQDPEYVGTVAQDAWKLQHFIRFGYAGEPLMPRFHEHGWTLQNVLDVVAHAQTLPTR